MPPGTMLPQPKKVVIGAIPRTHAMSRSPVRIWATIPIETSVYVAPARKLWPVTGTGSRRRNR